MVVGEEVQTRLLAGISVLHSWFLLDVICLVYPMGQSYFGTLYVDWVCQFGFSIIHFSNAMSEHCTYLMLVNHG